MAITLTTTLAAALARETSNITLASGTGATAGMIVKVDHEYAILSSISGVNGVLGMRGLYGSAQQSHKIGATVEISAAADFTGSPIGSEIPIPYSTPDLYTYGGGGAIVVPNEDARIFLTGATTACTLPLPLSDQDGKTLTVVAGAAAAFTVTVPSATGYKNTAGTATFGGAIGDNMVITAYKAQWLPVSVINVTFA